MCRNYSLYVRVLQSHYGSQSLARNLALTTNAIVDEAGSAFDAAPSASQKQISVCRCDSVGTCDSDHLMTKQDELFLCVTATDNTTINNVQSLEFRQDGVSQSTITDGKSGEYTWVVKNGRSCMIRTRVKQEFLNQAFVLLSEQVWRSAAQWCYFKTMSTPGLS